jgi:hypothetical protein
MMVPVNESRLTDKLLDQLEESPHQHSTPQHISQARQDLLLSGVKC